MQLTQKEISTVYEEGAITDQMCPKWFDKFLGTDYILPHNKQFFAVRLTYALEDIQQLSWPLPTRSQVGDSQHTQNIQINKVIGENEKSVLYFTEKKLNDLLANTKDSNRMCQKPQYGSHHLE